MCAENIPPRNSLYSGSRQKTQEIFTSKADTRRPEPPMPSPSSPMDLPATPPSGQASWQSLQRRHLRRFRPWVQGGFALFSLYSGWQLYRFQQWAIGAADTYVPRPPAVEGFLPISALVAAKRLLLSGQYDPIHPAGLTIFLAALLLGLFLRKGFCGWICPVGFVSNLAERLGRPQALPPWLDGPLLSLKYLLLGFFLYLILWRMDLHSIEAFLASPYNLIVDVKMLSFFLHPSPLAGTILLALLLFSLINKNPWCRYLCPYGGLLGILALLSPFQVRREPSACIACHRCQRVCPAAIPVAAKVTVRSPECIGCLECVAACPVDDCLAPALGGRHRHPYLLPALILGVFLACWLAAKASGHWHSQIPDAELKTYHRMGQQVPQPN